MSTNFNADLMDNNSDSEDDYDYVPPAELSEKSEDETESSDEDTKTEEKKGKKRAREIPRMRKVEKKVDEDTKVEMPAVDEKKKANDLWKNFLDEVSEVKSESTSAVGSEASSPVLNSNKKEENSKTSTVGTSGVSIPDESSVEAVSVTNDACGVKPCADSLSDLLSSRNAKGKETDSLKTEDSSPVIASGKRKGLDSVLNKIMNKKQKVTTLEKSLVDWKSFKQEEGIEDDLSTYNKGKFGYIERQRFLERSDVRSFEVEKAMRLSRAKKS